MLTHIMRSNGVTLYSSTTLNYKIKMQITAAFKIINIYNRFII